jgi:hypothetical protein
MVKRKLNIRNTRAKQIIPRLLGRHLPQSPTQPINAPIEELFFISTVEGSNLWHVCIQAGYIEGVIWISDLF